MVSNDIKDLKRQLAKIQLERQRLSLLHNLSKELSRADGYEELAVAALNTMTNPKQLGIPWAAIGRVAAEAQTITDWMTAGKVDGSTFNNKRSIPLSTSGGPIAQSVLQATVSKAEDLPNLGPYSIQPLSWGNRPVGVLLLPAGHDSATTEVIEEICEQVASRLGVMQNRLQRARETAIEEERNRIAIDMHDTVSQSLFGMIFSLDACLKMRPDDPSEIYSELEQVKTTAEGVYGEIRQTIHDMWVEMTSDRFQKDIRSYLTDVLQAVDMEMDFDIRGDFSSVSPEVHRTLYRVCQEALTNTVHHAAATDIRVCLDVLDERVGLIVRDNGRGFNPLVAMQTKEKEEHFGIRGIQERINLLGGTCDFFSRPEMGTSLVIDVPVAFKKL